MYGKILYLSIPKNGEILISLKIGILKSVLYGALYRIK
tara:strand:- start:536 stop:649 length:114 start_codon:yes stop_codon:yes gene_type:complete